MKKFIASVLALSLIFTPTGFAARPGGTANRPSIWEFLGLKSNPGADSQDLLSPQDLLSRELAMRSEARVNWQDLDSNLFSDLGTSLERYDLELTEIQYSPLTETQEAPLQTLRSRLAWEIVQGQAIAAANYIGIEHGKTKDQAKILKKEADGNSVSLAAEFLDGLAKRYGVRIVVIGNEGATRDEAPAIPNLHIYNEEGKNGTFLFINDAVEGTNYLMKGLLGSWSIIALLDEHNSYSTDGYRATVTYRAKRRAEGLDPVLAGPHAVRNAFEKIASADDQNLAFWLRDKHVVVLGDRKRHASLIAELEQLEAEGLTYETVPDGDFVPRVVHGAFGVRTKDDREVVVIGVGGANEHKLALVAAALNKPDAGGRRAFAASRYVTHKGLNDDLANADNFPASEIDEFDKLNATIALKGLSVGQVNTAKLTDVETEESIVGQAVVLGTAITGARRADLDRHQLEAPAISFEFSPDDSGRVITTSFLADENGNLFLIRSAYETADLLKTRLKLLVGNEFHPTGSIFYPKVIEAQSILDSINNIDFEKLTEKGEFVGLFRNLRDRLIALDGLVEVDDQNLLASEITELDGAEDFRGQAKWAQNTFYNVARNVVAQLIGIPTVEIDGVRTSILVPARSEARITKLREIASKLYRILAADESDPTAGKRLKDMGLDNTLENQERMRRVVLTWKGAQYAGIGAVIFFETTLDNKNAQGQNLVDTDVVGRGILGGIKIDKGVGKNPNSPKESIIKRDEMFEALPALLEKARAHNLVFTKQRSTEVIDVVEHLPTNDNIRQNAIIQAEVAKRVQDEGFVPITEPEVLFDGTHDIAASYEATTRTLAITYEELVKANVDLRASVLKTSMILSGKDAPNRASAEEVGYYTLKGLLKSVPSEVPSIVFLSGGQGDTEAVENLNEVILASQNRFKEARDEAVRELRAEGNITAADKLSKLRKTPWNIGYSFGRGLQSPGLKVWQGKDENFEAAQAALLHAALATAAAQQGRLHPARSEARLSGSAAHPVPEPQVQVIQVDGRKAVVELDLNTVETQLIKSSPIAVVQVYPKEVGTIVQESMVEGSDTNKFMGALASYARSEVRINLAIVGGSDGDDDQLNRVIDAFFTQQYGLAHRSAWQPWRSKIQAQVVNSDAGLSTASRTADLFLMSHERAQMAAPTLRGKRVVAMDAYWNGARVVNRQDTTLSQRAEYLLGALLNRDIPDAFRQIGSVSFLHLSRLESLDALLDLMIAVTKRFATAA